MHKIMDFRSDTVTRPTDEMRKVIASAEVGDDIYGDDPSSNALSAYAAEITGKEAALYACSGTMGNLLAFCTAGHQGESIIVGTRAHVWNFEVGGLAAVAGLCPYSVCDDDGIPKISDIEQAFHGGEDIHHAPTTMLALENTHNFAGGIAVPPDAFAAAARTAHKMGLHVHLDGARIFNAAVFHGVDVKEYTKEADSVQFCLSKGLGAPLGSMLCGTHDFIERAKKWRKRLGGSQRQLGIAAAAGLYALKNNIPRLAEDHKNAKKLSELLTKGGVDVEHKENSTNMVFFDLGDSKISGDDFVRICAERGLLLDRAASPRRVRLVTHLDIDSDDIERAAETILSVLAL